MLTAREFTLQSKSASLQLSAPLCCARTRRTYIYVSCNALYALLFLEAGLWFLPPPLSQTIERPCYCC